MRAAVEIADDPSAPAQQDQIERVGALAALDALGAVRWNLVEPAEQAGSGCRSLWRRQLDTPPADDRAHHQQDQQPMAGIDRDQAPARALKGIGNRD